MTEENDVEKPPKKPNQAGLKLNGTIHKEIVKWLKDGLPQDSAAAMAGISARTLNRWIRRGRAEIDFIEMTGIKNPSEARYVKLYKECMKALAIDEAACVNSINQAVPGDWRAALSKLERRYPQNWSPKTHVVVEAELTQLFQAMKDNLDKETYERVLRAVRGPTDRSGASADFEDEE